MVSPVAVSGSPSMSLALTSSSAWVMSRGPLSSAMGARVTGAVVGASLTGVTSIETAPVSVRRPSLTV